MQDSPELTPFDDVDPARLALQADVEVDPFTGSVAVRVPLRLTPGRGGAQPDLALTYRPQGGNGAWGQDWTLEAIPAIAVDTSRRLPRYDGTDSFAFGGTELTPALGPDGSQRTATLDRHTVQYFRPQVAGQPARFERWIADDDGRVHWRCRAADDTVTVFGERRDGSTRIADPAAPDHVFAWLPELRIDAYGDAVAFEYVAEDLRGVDLAGPVERTRSGRSQPQRHLKRVRYANARPLAPGDTLPDDEWRIELVLDYGDHRTDGPDVLPDRPWPARQDPFSTCRPGFEVRTWRLCHRFLLFHRFAALGAGTRLISATDLGYAADAAACRLLSITYTGFRSDAGIETRAALPPLRFAYSEPERGDELDALGAATVATGVSRPRPELVDLRGDGLPGLLVKNDDAWYYRPNEGGGRFGAQRRLAERPTQPAVAAGLGDFDRDGDTDLVELRGRLAGRATYHGSDDRWDGFAPFRSAARLEAAGARAHWLDLDGDGCPELVLGGDSAITWFPGEGAAGFGSPRQTPFARVGAAAAPVDEDPDRNLFLLDVNGDGVVDQVRIGNGFIEYWPHFGQGRFGERVTMEGAPTFAPDGEFDPARLRFADLRGTGTPDVIYLGQGEVRWWVNAGGNRMLEGGRVGGLPYLDAAAFPQIVDLLGTGVPCLLWSSSLPSGEDALRQLPLRNALRPGLLVRVENSFGGESRLTWTSSAAHYLRDVASGRGWQTRLPAHVPVVETHEEIDHLAGTTARMRYAYHDGAFDGERRAFRGFAFVERFEGEAAPRCVRTWFHSGSTEIERRLGDAYAGDALLGLLPAAEVEPLEQLSSAEFADALRTLAGAPLREEVFALGRDSRPAPAPFSVTQTRYAVRRLQRGQGSVRTAFRRDAVERLTHVYEQTAGDARVQHHFALDVDEDGQARLACEIAYPRRPVASRLAGQREPVASVHRSRSSRVDTPQRFEVEIDVESSDYELNGLSGGAPLTFGDVHAAVFQALAAPLSPGEPFVAGRVQARLTGRQRTLYWDAAQANALPLGQVGPRTLLHHEETACLTDALVAALFDGRVTSALLAQLGYVNDASLWWRRDPIQRHLSAGAFFALAGTERWDGARTSLEYDADHLRVITATDAAQNQTLSELDYHLLEPHRITDANGCTAEALHDALGIPVRVTQYGTIRAPGGGDVAHGQEPLAAAVRAPSVDELIADPDAQVSATMWAAAHDLGAWTRARAPARLVRLESETLARDATGGRAPPARTRVAVAYLDGSGRPLQEKLRVEGGPAVRRDASRRIELDSAGLPLEADAAERWLTSAWVTLDGNGRPVREYDPYFSPTADFEPDGALGTPRRIGYDALGRAVREDEPDGTYAHTVYGPWAVHRFDANDTVADSLYRTLRQGLPAEDPERLAVEGALAHADTPEASHFDPLGRVHRREPSAGADEQAITTVYDANGEAAEAVDGRGRTALRVRRDLAGRPLLCDTPDAGRILTLYDAADRPAHLWDARGVHIVRSFDRLDRPRSTRVDGALGLDQVVEEMRYGDDPGVSDAASRNLRGRLERHRDQAGVQTVDQYDPFGNVLRSVRVLRPAFDFEPNWGRPADVTLEAETHASEHAYDGLGRLVRSTLPDGVTRHMEYARVGAVGGVRLTFADGSPELRVLGSARFDARARLTTATLGNGVVLEERFDAETKRGRALRATRPAGPLGPERRLLDLAYTHDPVGNVTYVVDQAQQPDSPTPLLTGATVSTHRDFTYDALYRLRTATGRVHRALLEHDYRPGVPGGFRGTRRLSLNDGQAVERYTEHFRPDAAGNLTQIRHVGATQRWTTDLWVSPTSNRSLPELDPGGTETTDRETRFDAAGQLTWLPHLRRLTWNYRGGIAAAVVIERAGGAPDDRDVYAYDADGLRIAKRSERLVGQALETTEHLYLEGCVRKRIRRGDDLRLERVTSQIPRGPHAAALVHRWTRDGDRREVDAPERRVHYSLSDRTGSSVLELGANGAVVAYEEYLPYGSTAFIAGHDAREASLKDDRFAGGERDDATGLLCIGHRYYAPWLGRWLSPDPAGPVDSLNLYQYALGNPTSNRDPDGTQTVTPRRPSLFSEVAVERLPKMYRSAYRNLSAEDRLRFAREEIALAYDKETRSVRVLPIDAYRRQIEAQLARGEAFTQARLVPPSAAGGGGRGQAPAGPGAGPPAVRPPPAPPPSAPHARGADGGQGDATGKGTSTDTGGAGAHGADGGSTLQTGPPALGGERGSGPPGFGGATTGPPAPDAGTGAGAGAAGADRGTTPAPVPSAGGPAEPGAGDPRGVLRGFPGGIPGATGDPFGLPGGVAGGEPGGRVGGTIGGVPGGARAARAGDRDSVPGATTDSNGARYGSRSNTRAGAASGSSRAGAGAGGVPSRTDLGAVFRRIGDIANLQFESGGENARRGGISGGMGSGELGAAGSAVYLAVSLAGFVASFGGLIASFVRRIARGGLRAALRRGVFALRGLLPASKAALLRAASALKGALRGLYGLLRRELVEFMGAGARRARAFVTESALAAASGRTSVVRNAWIAEAIRRYLPNLRFTFRPRFSPYLEPFGVSVYRRGTQLGRLAFAATRGSRTRSYTKYSIIAGGPEASRRPTTSVSSQRGSSSRSSATSAT